MSTHAAIATVAVRKPLKIIQVPTIQPTFDEVLVKVDWTDTSPLDLHQCDSGLLIATYPHILGNSIAGTVVTVGPDAKNLKIGDKVFGFVWRYQQEKANQEFVTVSEYLLGKIPSNTRPESAITYPSNLVTIFHSLTADLGLTLPYPIPSNYNPPHQNTPILVWSGGSSSGQYCIQILRLYNYTTILTTSSAKHHSLLESYGATKCFDYQSPTAVPDLQKAVAGREIFVLDCIGSKFGSLDSISQIATVRGSKVAILLPVAVKAPSEIDVPEYTIDIQASAPWSDGVNVRGVRTHSYLDNEFFKDHLQPEIMPALLKKDLVKPNAYRIIEGETMLERAQNALDALRRKEVSGSKLVWRVSE